MNFRTPSIVAAVALACAATAAFAAAENDALAAANAKVSLTQAISVAEQHAAGKATKAEFERSKQGPVYEVEVVSGAKVFDVKVDADKGTVIASREDKVD
ncbi:PepSY domain-containing protein [Ottowia sp.]|uniref:PepSY domain-containing protein n=1 Tax=Ottowia sp. TaxID=1898956 RepID=UPI002CB901B2|nr:PepSY domain-containing protein [Pseudomonadota bacterium]HOV18894.1 PepSY domain-containing protein [Ottowia sp.]